jgi:hypothetical protein
MLNNPTLTDCCSATGDRLPVGVQREASAAGGTALRAPRARRNLSTHRRALEAAGCRGPRLLEVGGGVGAIQIELLKAGVTRAVSIEMTPTYEKAAGDLLA